MPSSFGGSIGSTMRNVEPRPISLVTSMRPPCIATRRRAMASPRPVPARRVRASRDCQYSWKIASCSSGAMPGPVSATSTATSAFATRQAHVDAPALGVLHRVADDVADDLAHATLVGERARADARERDGEALGRRADAGFANDLGHDRDTRRSGAASSRSSPDSSADRSRMSSMSARRCWPLPRTTSRFSRASRVERSVNFGEQHFGEAQNGVERRAQLVAQAQRETRCVRDRRRALRRDPGGRRARRR